MAVSDPSRIAVYGCGFWSTFQTAGWRELGDKVRVVAVCDPARDRPRRWRAGSGRT
jgi:predicted dehydrogenase